MANYIIIYIDGEKEEVKFDDMYLAEDYANGRKQAAEELGINNKSWVSITLVK
jgi:hypothetical protein